MKKLTTTIDGQSLTFGPLLAKTVRDHAQQIRRATEGQLNDVADQIELAVAVATASLQRVDASITEAQVLGLVDMGNYLQFYAAAMGQTLPEVPPGETLAGSHSG